MAENSRFMKFFTKTWALGAQKFIFGRNAPHRSNLVVEGVHDKDISFRPYIYCGMIHHKQSLAFDHICWIAQIKDCI